MAVYREKMKKLKITEEKKKDNKKDELKCRHCGCKLFELADRKDRIWICCLKCKTSYSYDKEKDIYWD